MPIYEYKCKKCGETFETLVRDGQKPSCPHCKSKRLEKLISGFGVGSSKSSGCAGGECRGHGSRGGGCCCGGHCHCGH